MTEAKINTQGSEDWESLVASVKNCQHCQAELPQPANPVLQLGRNAPLLIIGQAPGIKAHTSNTPWNDASGRRLRNWLGMSEQQFYDPKLTCIMPMGFCYPGKGSSGDLPPNKACAPLWHGQIFEYIRPALTLLIGQYAQQFYLRDNKSLTERVKNWRRYQPAFLPLPHPSPRNNLWLKRNPDFEKELVPELQKRVKQLKRIDKS